jgi:ribosome maturation factor RimP
LVSGGAGAFVSQYSAVNHAVASGRRAMRSFVTGVKLNPIATRVAELLESHVERLGFELVDVEYKSGTRNAILRLLIDRPQGRIALDELETLSRALGDLLDVYDPIETKYTLEVSSPGINRPLTKRSHFEAHIGRRVRVKTSRPRDGRKSFLGTLNAVSDEGIEVEDEIGKRREWLLFEEIARANYEHKFD